MNAFDIQIDHESLAVATEIINETLADAIDLAAEANVPAKHLMAALVAHICSTLVDCFSQTPDEIGRLTCNSAAAHVALQAAAVKH